MPAPEVVHQLVKRFEEHHETYHSSRYNETQLRREFLDPFFEREIRSRDGEIDRLVYELYGLSPEEIAIVEGSG